MAQHTIQEKALPVGLFILLSLALLVGGIVWLRNLSLQPGYTFTALFLDPNRVTPGIPAYFRGVKVGSVTEVALAEDLKHTLVTIGINDAELRLPETVRVHILMEGITGQRYVDIKPPVKEEDYYSDYLDEGDLVMGSENFTWEKLQEQLTKIAENGQIEKTLVSIETGMNELSVASGELRQFSSSANSFLASADPQARNAFQQISEAGQAVELAANDARGLLGGSGGTLDALPRMAAAMEGFNQNTEHLDSALLSLGDAAHNIGTTFDTLNYQLVDSRLIPNLSDAAYELRGGIRSVTGSVEQVSGNLNQLGASLGAQPTPILHQAAKSQMRQLDADVERLSDLLINSTDPDVQAPKLLLPRLRRLQQDTQAMQARLSLADDPHTLRIHMGVYKDSLVETQVLLDVLDVPLSQTLIRDAQRQVSADLEMMLETLERLSVDPVPTTPGPTAMGQPGAGISPATPGPLGTLASLGAAIRLLPTTIKRVDCVSSQLGDVLDERFLGFKLFFGNPGGDYDNCRELDSYPGSEGLPKVQP